MIVQDLDSRAPVIIHNQHTRTSKEKVRKDFLSQADAALTGRTVRSPGPDVARLGHARACASADACFLGTENTGFGTDHALFTIENALVTNEDANPSLFR